ncbi:hypothetical protein C6382_20195 [Pseudomonas sp. BBP2017]|nr:hypothetical protein C6382_20195 [Pseudomonas sp. BBP2017]
MGVPAFLEGEAAALKSMVIGSEGAFLKVQGLGQVVAVFCQTLLIHTPGAAALLRLSRCMPTLRGSLPIQRPDLAVQGISRAPFP